MKATLLSHRSKSVVFLMAAFFGFLLGNQAQTIVTIGTGTTQNSSYSYPCPYGNWYKGAKEQMLILASELTAAGAGAGTISALGFSVSSPAGAPLTGFTISVGHTTAGSLPGFITSGLTQVYNSGSYTTTSGWNTHTFSTNFEWDGTNNLLIETCFENPTYSSNAVMYQTPTSFVSTRDYHTDAGGACTSQTSQAYSQRPNMQLTFSQLPTLTIVEGHAYDGTYNNPLPGVEIGFLENPQPYDPVLTDSNGYFSFDSIPAEPEDTYDMYAFLEGQNYVVQEVTVVEGQAVTVNWNMASPLMVITPGVFEETMNPNEYRIITITITNGPTGGPLSWTLKIIVDDTLGDVNVSDDNGDVQAGESETVDVMFAATGAEPGQVWTADIVFTAQPNVISDTVNVSMIIAGDPLVPVDEIIYDGTLGDVNISWTGIDDSLTGGNTFEYYLIRRNGAPIATTVDTSYTDSLSTFGEYCYTVSAVYTEGESVPAGPECIIYCEAPSDLDGEYYWNGEDDFGAEIWWEAGFSNPSSNLSGFNIYRMGPGEEEYVLIDFIPYDEGVADYSYMDEDPFGVEGYPYEACYQVTSVWESGTAYCESMPANCVNTTDDWKCITITDLGIPVAICRDVTTAADENCVAYVTPEQVDNGSFNPGGGAVTLTLSPPAPYPFGNNDVILTASNGSYQDTCSATITVEDITPPVLTATSDTMTLWPPNLQYATYIVGDLVSSVWDNCAPLSLNAIDIVKGTSDEPDSGEQCGNKPNDIIIASDCKSVQLRRERCGGGNGRIYTIYLEVDDGNGNTGYDICKIEVPLNNNGTAIDDGPVYEVLGNCGNGPSFPAGNKNSVSEITLTNYPNPFTSSTTLVFSIPEAGRTMLKLYNSIGKEVRVLFDGYAEANRNYEIIFTGEGLPEGLYICRMQSGNEHCTRRIVLVR